MLQPVTLSWVPCIILSFHSFGCLSSGIVNQLLLVRQKTSQPAGNNGNRLLEKWCIRTGNNHGFQSNCRSFLSVVGRQRIQTQKSHSVCVVAMLQKGKSTQNSHFFPQPSLAAVRQTQILSQAFCDVVHLPSVMRIRGFDRGQSNQQDPCWQIPQRLFCTPI